MERHSTGRSLGKTDKVRGGRRSECGRPRFEVDLVVDDPPLLEKGVDADDRTDVADQVPKNILDECD